MQIDIKNNNTNILEYEFTLNDFAKNFFVQEINNDFYPFHYASLGTTPTDPEPKIEYFNRGEQWVGSSGSQTVSDEKGSKTALRIANLWSYGLPILHIEKKVDNPQEYKYITIDFDFNSIISNSTTSDAASGVQNKINTTLSNGVFDIAINKNIVYSDTNTYFILNNLLSNNLSRYTKPYTASIIPITSISSNMAYNFFIEEHNKLSDVLTTPTNKSKILPYKYRSCFDLYIQLSSQTNYILYYLYSLKKSLAIYAANGNQDPVGEFQNCIKNEKFIYDNKYKLLLGFVDININLYANGHQSYLSRVSKGLQKNILDILNQKVMVYLSKEPIY